PKPVENDGSRNISNANLEDTKTEDEYNLARLQEVVEQEGIASNSNLSALQGKLVEAEEREEGYVKLEVWQNEQAMQNQNAAYWLGIYVAFCFIEIVWAMMQWVVTFIGGLKASRNIHNQLLHSIVHATPRFFDTTPVGRIINRFSRDMQTVDFGIVSMVVSWFSGIMSLVVTFIIISSIIPMFTIGAMIISISYAVIAFYYLNTSRELKRLESNSMSPLLSLFDEVINGVSTIRAFNAKKYYIMEALNRINQIMQFGQLTDGLQRVLILQVQ
ncbi:hypothetical protein GGI25_006519, partial [Coemansia spiralis]